MADLPTELKQRRRWRRWLGLGLLLVLAAPCLPWPLPHAELVGQRPAVAPPRGAPEIWVPRRDAAGGNDLRAVFVHTRADGAHELTLWFRDEDHPWIGVDQAYDLFRWARWKRVDDLETLVVTPARDLALTGVAAGDQGFSVLWAEHHTSLIGRGATDRLYVRTWNHLLSSEPEPGIDYVKAEAPWLRGSRAELEAEVRAGWPD